MEGPRVGGKKGKEMPFNPTTYLKLLLVPGPYI